jgi:hypothetical protein
MDDQLDAVVVGGAGVDTNVYLAGDDIDWSVETNFTRNVDCVGQAGGYSSRLFAQLGKRIGYIGPVGDDHAGRLVRDTLARDGVDLTGCLSTRAVPQRQPRVPRRPAQELLRRPRIDDAAAQPGAVSRRAGAGAARPLLDHALGPSAAADRARVRRGGRRRSPGRGDRGRPYRQDFVDGADILLLSGVNHPDPAP